MALWGKVRRFLRRNVLQPLRSRGGYRPVLLERCDHPRLIAEAAELTGRPEEEIAGLFDEYRALHRERNYETTLGEVKTLCFEEAFLIYALLAIGRPRTIVEIGTQHGRSTRRILDMKSRLGLECEVVCYDIEDQVRHFGPHEARLVLKDLTGRFREEVLGSLRPGFVFVDARPYPLLKNVIAAWVESDATGMMAIHDCARGLCNPRMGLDRADPRITSETGVWERHVLAEVFAIDDPLSESLDRAELPSHKLRIFGTRHGLGIILPRTSAGAARERLAGAVRRDAVGQSRRRRRPSRRRPPTVSPAEDGWGSEQTARGDGSRRTAPEDPAKTVMKPGT